MAHKFRVALATLIVALALAAALLAQSSGGQNVMIDSQGGPLPPGNHPAVITVKGRKVAATVKVDAAPPPSPIPPPPKPDPSPVPNGGGGLQPAASSSAVLIVLAAIVPILLIAVGAWVYFKIIKPRKQLEPYKQALELVRDKKYEEALPLLTQVESKLPDHLRPEARFFIAFACYNIGQTNEAEHALAGLHRENPKDENAAYLLAHIRVAAEKYDEAEPVLEQMEKNAQLKLHHAKKLFGVVEFRRALAALQEGRVDAAADLFEKVEKLGDFASQIPADLRNRHVALGTRALFDKDLAEARKQFETLQKAVAKENAKQRDQLLATATLGLAMIAWLEENAESYATVERLLVEAAKLLDAKGQMEMEWPEEAKGLSEQLKELGAQTDMPAEKKELDHCLRDIHFLRGIASLRHWGQMNGETAHQQIEAQYQRALARFACARARDEQFADTFLVVGLLVYYLQKPGPERRRGIDLLEQAQQRGMHEPDAVEIINNRARIEQANVDAVDMYMQVLDKYLHDDTVRKELRLGLIERLGKYKRIQTWNRRPDLQRARTVEPTVAEMCNRSEILRARVEQIVTSVDDPDAVSQMQSLSNTIMENGRSLIERAAIIEKNESELLALTGTQLLKEQ